MGRILSRVAAGGLVVMAGASAEPPGFPSEQVVRSEERSPLLQPLGGKSEPWLGVSVHKPSEALYAKLEGVPKGIGFVLHGITAEGPAAAAGLRQYDFLWKLNDQLLVNEAQFLVLLHSHGAGDAVTLTYQRDGENHECRVVLGERPTTERGQQQADLAVMRDPPVPGLSKQMVDILRQVASIRDDDGVTARLERRGEVFRWQQIDADGMLIQEGDVKGVDDIRFPPGTNEALAKKLKVMIRAFEDAERRAKSGVRSSRVRRVPVEGGR